MKKQILKIAMTLLIVLTSTFADTLKVLDHLYTISGEKILSGQHNREPNSDPDKWTEYIYETTGKYPALWSGDFLFQQSNIDNRWTMIYEAKEQWDKGAVINLMWHACPPDQDEPCDWDPGVINAQLDDNQWNELITDGTDLNNEWKKRMDDIAVYLQYLEDNEVEVLFRPLHEMNQGKFWWGGRPGTNGTAELYRITHNYFTNEKGLSNLIWVWNMQDLSWDFEAYNPGDDYWDVFTFDIYDSGFDVSWYNYILEIVGEKPMAIGECMKLPTADMLESQPRWVFFMSWAELVQSHNTIQEIRNIYNNSRVITRDEMPGWGEFGDTPYEIVLSTDVEQLLNNGISTAEIKAILRDEEGLFCGNSTNEITYSVIGNGKFTTSNVVNAEGGRSSIFYQSPADVGIEKIVASSPGLISDTVEIEITNTHSFDDFEDYKDSYELGVFWLKKSTSMARLYLEKTIAYDSNQSLKFNYKIGDGAPPYSSIYKENSDDLRGCKYLGFWHKPTGKSNQMAIRLSEGNGTIWDYYFDIEGDSGKYTEVALADFSKYSGASDSINLADIAEISINILKGNGEYGESVIYLDDIKFLTEKSTVAIDDEIEKKTDNFRLKQNFPNPFNPETTIEFQLNKSSDVKLQVFDLQGNLIETLMNNNRAAGNYRVTWNATNHASGIYVYKLITGNAGKSRKCLLLK